MGVIKNKMGCGPSNDEAPTAAGAEGDKGTYPPTGLSSNVLKLPEWIQLGCGDKPYNCSEKNATFAPDGQTPAEMPDLSKHSNFMKECLTQEIWDKLKDKKTSGGTTLAECIKTGVDNPGHPHIKTVGMTACDEESYEVFKELFDPVNSARHGGYAADAIQPTNLDTSQLSDTDIDPEGKYVLTTRVRTGRSIKGFQLPPTISFEDRRKLEALSVKALLAMEGDLKGEYFPLHGSQSYAAKPTGMTEEKEEQLRKCGNLFQEPDSTLLLASGMGRHWPDGRGVFENEGKNLFVWVGEEDHLRIVSMQGSRETPSAEGKNIKAVTARFMDACAEVKKVLKAEGADFMHNDHLGWVLTCPSNLGTGGVDSANVGGTWDVSNADRIGKGEVDLVNTLIEGAAQLVKWESMCDNSKKGDAEREIQAVLAISAFGDLAANAGAKEAACTGERITTKVHNEFKKDFASFDKNSSGFLDMNEVSEMVKLQSGSAPSSTALDQMMAQFDTNADGAINLDEYLNVIFGKGWSVGTPLVTIKPSAVDAAAGLRAKFDSIDKDKTGSIDAAEFAKALADDANFRAMLEKSGIYTGWADGAMLQLQTGMNDSKLTWKEFKAKVSTPEQASAKAALRAKFDEVDANGTGKVGKKQLSKALREDKVLLTQIAETHPVLACWVEPLMEL